MKKYIIQTKVHFSPNKPMGKNGEFNRKASKSKKRKRERSREKDDRERRSRARCRPP